MGRVWMKPWQPSSRQSGGLVQRTVAIPRVIVPTNLHIDTVCAAIVMATVGSRSVGAWVLSAVAYISLVTTTTMTRMRSTTMIQPLDCWRADCGVGAERSRWPKLAPLPAYRPLMRRRATHYVWITRESSLPCRLENSSARTRHLHLLAGSTNLSLNCKHASRGQNRPSEFATHSLQHTSALLDFDAHLTVSRSVRP